jgi:3-phosphoinositide dependent protein kinase-1
LDELDESEKVAVDEGSSGAEAMTNLLEVKFEPDHMERRGTFVGTVNYLAPEMIEKNTASMATDIWSLGCIIFKLITGNVPFTGIDPNLVFAKILKKDVDFPEYLSVDAVSFIDSLLMIKPLERLGSPGSPCGIENLKKHPFLKGIDFSTPVGPRLTDYHRSLILGGDSPTLDNSNLKNVPRRSAFMTGELAFSNVIIRGYLLKKNRWFNK